MCTPRYKLTPRELEALTWVAEGKSAKEISCILQISVPTVNFHLKNIREKLDAVNRHHMVAIAIQEGLI